MQHWVDRRLGSMLGRNTRHINSMHVDTGDCVGVQGTAIGLGRYSMRA